MRRFSKSPGIISGAILAVLLLASLVIISRTIIEVGRFQTNVLWRDQWWFLGELKSFYEGKNWAGILWSPYWGHRPVVPRLLFYLDARLFSFRNAPLLYASWMLWFLQAALLLAADRAIFGRFFSWRYLAALIVTLNLCFSSFSLENLIWALQIQYILVFFCATLSFVLLALSAQQTRSARVLLAACILSALIGSLTMMHGMMIWPALAFQAFLCRKGRRLWLTFLLAFIVFGGIYAIGYQMPQTGMGIAGQLHRPMRALELGLLVLGGPVTNQSLGWGIAVGAVGLLALLSFIRPVYRDRNAVWLSVHLALVLFVAAIASLTVAGRISPELLHAIVANGGEILPSRYQTFFLLFWTGIFTLGLYLGSTARPARLRAAAILAALLPFYFVLSYARLQSVVTDAWVDGMRAFDATGTSFLVGVPDWERQKLLWSNRIELENWVAFAREHRLANFSEARLAWLNRNLQEQFQITDGTRCEGKLESFDPIAEGMWRVNGWAWDIKKGRPPDDIVLAGADGRIEGLARSGIRHHDTGGHTAPVVIYRAGWLGYMRDVHADSREQVRAYAVIDGGRGACPLESSYRRHAADLVR